MMKKNDPINIPNLKIWDVTVVESNQHSLHDIYVHGGLYPTHARIQCLLILMHVHDWEATN